MRRILPQLLTLLLLTHVILIADDAKARSIMQKVDTRDNGKTVEEDMTMVLIDKKGRKRTRVIKSYSKDYGRDEYRVMFFKSPADVKNTAFLTYDYKDSGKDDDQWIYLPALKKVKRIPSSDKSSAFMGSDFSYFDMTDRNLHDYDFRLLKETEVRGHPAWMIEALPRSKKIEKESGYKKSIDIVRKDNYLIVRSIEFMKNGKKKYMDMTKMHQQNGIWVTDELTMTTKRGKKTLHKTILQFTDIKLNKPLPDTMFKTRRLEQGL